MRVGLNATCLNDRPMKKVVHLIPFDGIGGVEIAAQSMPDGPIDAVTIFQKWYIFADPDAQLNHPFAYLACLKALLREKPDLMIASLWRAYFVLILFKIINPRAKVVTFLHNTKCAHQADRILAWLAMHCSTAIWADSKQTIESRVPEKWHGWTRDISYLIDKPNMPISRPFKPNFVFWGRLVRQKRLDRAIRLFALIHRNWPNAKFDIIGPDQGDLARLKKQAIDAGLEVAIRFHGGLAREACFEKARDSTFYLQTSEYEGMAVSVVEAMQRGLIPVVTPVGEIPRYCHDGSNAILVDDLEEAARRVANVLSDPEMHDALWRAAVAEWQGQPLYRDDMIGSIKSITQGSV